MANDEETYEDDSADGGELVASYDEDWSEMLSDEDEMRTPAEVWRVPEGEPPGNTSNHEEMVDLLKRRLVPDGVFSVHMRSICQTHVDAGVRLDEVGNAVSIALWYSLGVDIRKELGIRLDRATVKVRPFSFQPVLLLSSPNMWSNDLEAPTFANCFFLPYSRGHGSLANSDRKNPHPGAISG